MRVKAGTGQWRGAAGVACIMGAAIAAGAAAQQTPLFRADVNLVVVEASVVDRAGGIARGLQPADFRVEISGQAREVILATSATVDGQTTAHYIADRLSATGVIVTRLAHGLPVGGELNYLDDGTLGAALEARRPVPVTNGMRPERAPHGESND